MMTLHCYYVSMWGLAPFFSGMDRIPNWQDKEVAEIQFLANDISDFYDIPFMDTCGEKNENEKKKRPCIRQEDIIVVAGNQVVKKKPSKRVLE